MLSFPSMSSSLRSSWLLQIGRESAELHSELRKLEQQSLLSSSYAGSVTEALEPFEQNSTRDMFQGMSSSPLNSFSISGAAV